MTRRIGTMLASVLLTTLSPSLAQKNKATDIPVTTYVSDYDSGGNPYYVQSDGLGPYPDTPSTNVYSVLVVNGYNHIVNGDWRLDMYNSTARTVGITFSTANAVQPGDPGYTAPANPPYWGTQLHPVRMENKCTMINHDMLTMKPGDKFTCPTILKFSVNGTSYRLDMAASWTYLNEPETQDPQVSCNSADSGGCNDWFIDPVPTVNPDGSTSPGKARARLNGITDDGDFYLTFHIHVTRP